MSAISKFYTTTLTVQRMVYVADKSSWSEVGDILAHVQQLSPEKIAQIAGQNKLTHTVWCALDADVQEGDLLIDGTTKYTVKGKIEYNNGQNNHVELFVIK